MSQTTNSLSGAYDPASKPNHHRLTYNNTSESTLKSGLVPFDRPFFPELRAEILSYLPGSDLKSCTLASRAFHADAARYLWHGSDYWHDEDISSSLWALFAQALMLMSSVSRLDLMIAASRDLCGEPVSRTTPKALYAGLATAAFAKTLSHLSFDGPRDSVGLPQLIELFPNLHTLVCYSDNDDNPIPHNPTLLVQLQKAHGPPELSSMLSNHSTSTTFHPPSRRRHEITVPVAKVGRLIRSIQSLRHLCLCGFAVEQTAENLPRVLSLLAHPELESLTITVDHNDRWPASFPITSSTILSPSSIFGILAPQTLSHLPSIGGFKIASGRNQEFVKLLSNFCQTFVRLLSDFCQKFARPRDS
ncbi:hypothetical protein DL93DRAFT_2234651 [Clavulina sp. PMI_390]|nr:hypothetical protein DL93DRAFT_2234651 [Clavulina sp. PMI_390]